MAKRAKRNYVNNADFLEALIAYKAACIEAENAGDIKPRCPDYIGKCIYQIATRLATKPNFSGYTYKDDMISDGIENCLLYMGNFNSEKSSNPFAYFTQIIWYAFLRRIQKEKKQMYIRFKSSQVMVASGGTYSGEGDLNLTTNVDYMNSFVQDYEDKIAKDKAKKKASMEEAAIEVVDVKEEDPEV
jgi:hypothetical protein|tara:strand:+ start:652 stop:1212 length:561 start_codon:yes stop_codon:yes gene_type:complete